MIKRMIISNGREYRYRVNVAGLSIEFLKIEDAFRFAYERLSRENYPVIKKGNVEWWNKRIVINNPAPERNVTENMNQHGVTT